MKEYKVFLLDTRNPYVYKYTKRCIIKAISNNKFGMIVTEYPIKDDENVREELGYKVPLSKAIGMINHFSWEGTKLYAMFTPTNLPNNIKEDINKFTKEQLLETSIFRISGVGTVTGNKVTDLVIHCWYYDLDRVELEEE